MSSQRRWVWIVGVLAAIAIALYVRHQNEKKAEAAALNAELAVSKLPPGVAANWVRHIDAQLASGMQITGSFITVPKGRFSPIFVLSKEKSRFFSVECEEQFFSISVKFGNEEGAAVVDVAGYMAEGTSPPLGVNRRSVAARNLLENLCRYTAEKVQERLNTE